ncbi:hypothetical protein PENOC_013380 [Penicillium occitanis (nom. inval.)]|nr:hypothetical protein PENOC_013380 [Penicillium occitanis (nom. inval.)]
MGSSTASENDLANVKHNAGSVNYTFTENVNNIEDTTSLESGGKESVIDGRSENEDASTEITYPEGGRTAWLVVLGSWMSCFGSMGLMNCLGIFQAYLGEHQLQPYSSSDIAWIFGVYSFLAFFCGVEVGPVFDAKGPRPLILLGGLGTVAFLLLLEVCTEYWHFMLCFGLLGGKDLMLATMGIFFMEWGLFIPLTYLTSFALDINMSSESSYLLLSLVNAAAVFGRWIPGWCADRLGRFNTLIITIVMCLVFIACLWMPAQSKQVVSNGSASVLAIAFAVLFGFASGSNVSLAPVCIGQLCRIERFGRTYATAYVIVSISTLTGIPICGAILQRCNGEYWGLITFAIVSYAASLVCLAAAKISHCGWDQMLAIF